MAVVVRLRERGFTGYLAGGCVRDELLGEPPKDFDVATDARPGDIRAAFRRTGEVGAAFGVMLVREFGPTIEVATFRSDGVYSDRRRPDSVRFADALSDARRRDFTINALFIDPLVTGQGRVIDLVDGRRDLDARTLRAVGDPDARLGEDPLRALRGARFAARYGLTIEAGTASAIRRHASGLGGVSRERVGDELRRILTHPTRAQGAQLLHDLGLAGAVFQEERAYDGLVMERLTPGSSFLAALMALLIGRGDGVGLRESVEAPGAEPGSAGRIAGQVAAVRRALVLSNDERDGLRDGLNALRRARGEWDAMGEAGRKRLASGAGFADALCVLNAMDPERAGSIGAEVERLRGRFGGLAPTPLLDGEGLIAMGLTPGPRFAAILITVYDAQLEGRVGTVEEARAMVAGP